MDDVEDAHGLHGEAAGGGCRGLLSSLDRYFTSVSGGKGITCWKLCCCKNNHTKCCKKLSRP